MSVKVYFDPQSIYSQIQKSTDVALKEVATQVLVDTDRYVPLSKPSNPGHGTLRNSVQLIKNEKNSFEITYSRPVAGLGDVAESLYEGFNPRTGLPVKKWSTPGTGDHWLDRSIQDNYESWIEFFREETKRKWRERKQKY